MATYAEYPPNNMASNDFTLYPYPEVWNQDQTYLPSSTYADQSYLTATTFDSYQSQQSFAPLPEQYDFNQTIDQSKHLRAPSAHDSPASHHYDYTNPPALSSVSDSGASVQSTISSAMGSPSAQPQSHEWAHQSTHMFPSIVQPADGIYSTSSFDFETNYVTDKGCVGELTTISSSDPPQHALSFDSSLLSHTPHSGNAGDSATWSSPGSWTSTLVPHESRSSSLDAISPSDTIFRSPTTPASATSPVLERLKHSRRQSTTSPSSRAIRASSPLSKSMSYDELDTSQCPQAAPAILPSPFFSQSSGAFVFPLESSCPSSLFLAPISLQSSRRSQADLPNRPIAHPAILTHSIHWNSISRSTIAKPPIPHSSISRHP